MNMPGGTERWLCLFFRLKRNNSYRPQFNDSDANKQRIRQGLVERRQINATQQCFS